MTVVVDRTLPRIQRDEDLQEWARRLVDDLHQRLYEIGIDLNAAPTATTSTYTPTNVTTDRTYDADATTTAELADVLGTLIADLQSSGIIL